MSPDLVQYISAEFAALNRLIEKNKRLIVKVTTAEPDEMEIAALGAMLHSFYGGIENMFKRIALDFDGSFHKTASWHKALLDGMTTSTEQRPAVISEVLRTKIHRYLDFRHVFRSAYSYDLNWNKMRDLVFCCEETFNELQKEVQQFIES